MPTQAIEPSGPAASDSMGPPPLSIKRMPPPLAPGVVSVKGIEMSVMTVSLLLALLNQRVTWWHRSPSPRTHDLEGDIRYVPGGLPSGHSGTLGARHRMLIVR